MDLAAQPLSLLELLVRHPGRLVDRETIRRHLWGTEVHVDFDQGINAAVRQVRRALRDDAANPRFIVTVPRRGYRFVAPVEALAPAVPPATPARPPGAERAEGAAAAATAGPHLPVPAAGAAAGGAPSRAPAPLILRLATVLAVLVVPAFAAWVGGDDVPPPDPRRPVRLVVLPFAGPGGGDGDWLSAGFTDELILGLSRLRRPGGRGAGGHRRHLLPAPGASRRATAPGPGGAGSGLRGAGNGPA